MLDFNHGRHPKSNICIVYDIHTAVYDFHFHANMYAFQTRTQTYLETIQRCQLRSGSDIEFSAISSRITLFTRNMNTPLVILKTSNLSHYRALALQMCNLCAGCPKLGIYRSFTNTLTNRFNSNLHAQNNE